MTECHVACLRKRRAILSRRLSEALGLTTRHRKVYQMHLLLPASLQDPASRSAFGWAVVRLTLAALLAAHGWARFLAGGVAPFGDWLDGLGFPFGLAIATFITGFEIVGTILLALGKLVFPLTLVYACIYTMGIALVHAQAGWFVVGLGRNGSEYSVLLIICLLCVGLQHVKARATA